VRRRWFATLVSWSEWWTLFWTQRPENWLEGVAPSGSLEGPAGRTNFSDFLPEIMGRLPGAANGPSLMISKRACLLSLPRLT